MEVFIIGIGGYCLIAGLRKGASAMEFLSNLVLRVTLPCLVFSNLAKNFEPGDIDYWWAFPLLAVTINVAGALVARGYVSIDRTINNRGEFMALVAFQNGTFLPLALGSVLFGPDKLPHFLNVFFLYSFLQIPTFFTLAVWLVNAGSSLGQRLRSLANPPNIATILGLTFALTGWSKYVPAWVLRPMSAIGSMTATLAAFFIGGIIVTNLMKAKTADWSEPVKAALFKCLIIPILGTLIVYWFRPPEFIALFTIMQCAMPSALLIALVLPPNETKQKMVAAGILLSSLVSIITLPLFMGIFGALYW